MERVSSFDAHLRVLRDGDSADGAGDFNVVARSRPFVTRIVKPRVVAQIAEQVIVEDTGRLCAAEGQSSMARSRCLFRMGADAEEY